MEPFQSELLMESVKLVEQILGEALDRRFDLLCVCPDRKQPRGIQWDADMI